MRNFILLIAAAALAKAENDVCQQPKVVGPGDECIPRWYYNTESCTCEEFIYGGCNGNDNNFETKEDCENTCVDVCKLPKVVGPCKAAIPRWYYNTATFTCEKFTYGGCKGNGNNFETKEDCDDKCVEVCKQPKLVGPCEAYIPRWYYNTATFTCEKFTYGGCKGNGNNFETKEDCDDKCVEDICKQKKLVGPCKAYVSRWYYNTAKSACEKFIYGGCNGNDNNFETKEDCEYECVEDDGTCW